jgi:hypothetical protein
MKAIKIFFSLLIVVALVISCNDTESINGETIYDEGSFIRFFLLLDSNDDPIEAPDIENDETAVEEYTHASLKQLKIPVVLTYPGLSSDLTASFEVVQDGDFNGYSISPENTLNFSSNSYTDTITVSFTERWDASDTIQLNFELSGVSDNSVFIGSLNDSVSNSNLIVTLGELNTTVSFSTNLVEITGEAGEQIEFELEFENYFFTEEVEDIVFFSEDQNFDYTLQQVIEEGNNKSIKYIMTLNEDIQNDYIEYITTLELNTNSEYDPTGTTVLQIKKPINALRDNAVFTAANFYNLSDQYYRTYAELWLYDDSDGVCEWQRTTMFTYPVEVESDHENAVLYSDNGTEDESDDIYHHAFRIGFDSPNDGRTTNSFGLKYWFSNEYTDEDKSPGFNIQEALEFYPTDGNSETEGIVRVVSQVITISNSDNASYNISISGEGTYKEVSDGLFEIYLEFEATNEALFGGTQTGYYFMYNNSSYGGDPDDLNLSCIEEIEL